MSVKLLSFEDGIVRIGGEELPGLLSDLRGSGKVRFDEQSVDKASGKKKTPQGWEDADISLTLTLLTDESGTCYDKLAVLEGFFKKTDGKANPSIFTVANSHVLARGVRIAPGAHVKNCIIMQDGQVHSDASVENCILDKQTVIKRSARLIGPAAYPIVIAKNVVI